MSSNDGKKSEVRPERRHGANRISEHTASIRHLISTLPSGKQDGQSGSNQSDSASDNSSSSQSSEKDAGDKS